MVLVLFSFFNYTNPMARNKKKKNRKSRSANKADLPGIAQSYLSKGQFTEAIKAFRLLYKENGPGRWNTLFKKSFLGRIHQLRGKGMGTEALIIYDNMLLIFPDPDFCLHIRLLADAGQLQQAVKQRFSAGSTLSKNEKSAVDELFASLLLSGHSQLKDVLPGESPVCLHYTAAERALQAYCLQDDRDAYAALKEIPFRSPYKNFSLALKGMLAFDEDRNGCMVFFEKIPSGSSFLSLITPYRHLAMGNHGQAPKLAAMNLRVANTLEGMDASTSKLLDSLDKSGMSPSALYQVLVRTGTCLGRKQLRNICYRILPHAPGKAADFQKRFGKLSEYESTRINALSVELDGGYYGVDKVWQEVCDILIARDNSHQGNSLELALIYRHIAELMEKDSYEYSAKDVERMLTESLVFDNYDKKTWLKLVDLKRHNLAKRYKLVNAMLDIFPEDSEIITLGLEAAIQRGAFKKASRLGEKLLAVDPINPKVRRMLIDAHLSHAGKVAKQQKYEIALRECELAASFDRQDLSQGRVQIYHGLVRILCGDEAGGLKLFEEGEGKAAHPLLARFGIRLEAGLLNVEPRLLKLFTGELKKTAKTSFEKDVVLQLFENISSCNGDRYMELEKFRSSLTPCLKRAAGLAFSMDEWQHICKILHLRHYHDLLRVYAKAALKKHWGNPLFLFYQIYAQSNGGKKRMSGKQFDTLEDAWHDALDAGDETAARLIDNFLEENVPFMGPLGMGASPLQVIEKMFGGVFARQLESGEDPTEEVLDEMVEDIIDSGFPGK
ncbi:MAG: hypothetical protein KAI39_01255, partial [Desulfobulbaceae bacterium]|nr:hypothetical protein [Desulfobulbaceae bacterium]